MVPILKMRRFSCLLRLSLPPEMGEQQLKAVYAILYEKREMSSHAGQ